ncbi:MAG: hypothetical protein ISS65_06390 [Desulfobacterales bacterium]|uniref:Uncharacterized protein n=1 Tax=Candidatus Desulfatibia profunda TaxID=2841695 RepID=A0A8J6THT3_9BACT|nr:hypothetical protein [Candidatus Desulfatibia profunda]MBL7179824.1 hypothetical protein [Desulfobacterales bacterium]
MGSILKLDDHDEDKEIEFELNYLLSLTTRQRFQMMLQKAQEMRNLLKNHGYRLKLKEKIKNSGQGK